MISQPRALSYLLTVAFGVYATLMRRMGVRSLTVHSLDVKDL